jgi:hypothetical protein
VGWDELGDDIKASNIAQARDFPRKLRLIR